MSCEFCTDPDGEPCFPQYGLGPHTHHLDERGIHTSLDENQLADGFTPDRDEPGMGVYWCPHCEDGKPSWHGQK